MNVKNVSIVIKMVNFFLNSDLVVWHLEDGRFVDLNDVVSVPQSSVVRYGVERHLIKKNYIRLCLQTW